MTHTSIVQHCRPLCITASVLCIYSCACAVSAQIDFTYAIFDLDEDGGENSFAHGLNSSGVVVGNTGMTDGGGYRACVWFDTDITILESLANVDDHAQAINELGDIAGWGQTEAYLHPLLWSDGAMYELPALGGIVAYARDINDSGLIVGESEYEPDNRWVHATLWENMQAIDLGTFEDYGVSTALGINNRGQIVGYSWKESIHHNHAFLWQDGVMTDLGAFGWPYDESAAKDINDAGDIVGQADDTGGHGHAVLWQDGQIRDIHRPGYGDASGALAINNVGQIVGWVGYTVFSSSGAIWDAQHGLRDLNDLVPPFNGWIVETARDINDAGQIAAAGPIKGTGRLNDHAMLLSPVYPTIDLSEAQPGVAGQSNTITAANLAPSTKVYFTWGTKGGGTIIPGCNIQTNALQIDNPKVAGTAVADANGDAVLQGNVPGSVSGKWLLFQAVVPGECAISNLVVQNFE